MLQRTITRLEGLRCNSPSIVCNEEHRFMVAEQLRLIGCNASNIILEPVGKNTAPAVALAAIEAMRLGDDPILLVMAADHIIRNENAFRAAVSEGEALVNQDKIVTFGITATNSETGYGYIKGSEKKVASAIESFVEKPNIKLAQEYFASDDYYWNSGIFMFKASRYLKELGTHRPDILQACQKAMHVTTSDLDFTRIDSNAFKGCPSESIDYAIMEKASDVWVVPMNAGWSDVGSWAALHDIGKKDINNNVFIGDIIAHSTSNSYLRAESRLIATLGIDNVVVVETKDAVLVANSDRAQEIKKIVDDLDQAGRSEHKLHREVYRPWGKYDSIDNGQRYQVKRITVNPGERLSVQMHHHRAEHWIVVSGTAKVLRGEDELVLTENESIYIPLGTIHALENPGNVKLEIIEVQSGSYLGEDDIVRFNDRYGRK